MAPLAYANGENDTIMVTSAQKATEASRSYVAPPTPSSTTATPAVTGAPTTIIVAN